MAHHFPGYDIGYESDFVDDDRASWLSPSEEAIERDELLIEGYERMVRERTLFMLMNRLGLLYHHQLEILLCGVHELPDYWPYEYRDFH